MINKILTIFILIPILMRKTMEQQTGRFINLFDFCQPVRCVLCQVHQSQLALRE